MSSCRAVYDSYRECRLHAGHRLTSFSQAPMFEHVLHMTRLRQPIQPCSSESYRIKSPTAHITPLAHMGRHTCTHAQLALLI